MTADAGSGRPTGLWVTADLDHTPVQVCEGALTASAAVAVRSLFCATKPMVALGVLGLLERHGVDWRRGRLDPDGRIHAGGRWAVADVLAHRSPLVGPTIWQVLRGPTGSIEQSLAAEVDRVAADRAGPIGYSDVLSWYVLGRAAARVGGGRWALDLQRSLRAAGVQVWLAPDHQLDALPARALAAVGVSHRGGSVPLLHTLTARSRATVSPHLGGYGPFLGVVAWFRLLGAHLSGRADHPDLFPAPGPLRSALAMPEAPGPGTTYACALELQAGSRGAPVLGVRAAGASLSFELDLAGRRVTAVLGPTFVQDPPARREWHEQEWAAARSWTHAVVEATGQPAGEAAR